MARPSSAVTSAGRRVGSDRSRSLPAWLQTVARAVAAVMIGVAHLVGMSQPAVADANSITWSSTAGLLGAASGASARARGMSEGQARNRTTSATGSRPSIAADSSRPHIFIASTCSGHRCARW